MIKLNHNNTKQRCSEELQMFKHPILIHGSIFWHLKKRSVVPLKQKALTQSRLVFDESLRSMMIFLCKRKSTQKSLFELIQKRVHPFPSSGVLTFHCSSHPAGTRWAAHTRLLAQGECWNSNNILKPELTNTMISV